MKRPIIRPMDLNPVSSGKAPSRSGQSRIPATGSVASQLRGSIALQVRFIACILALCVAGVESVQLLIQPIVYLENRISRTLITGNPAVTSTLTHEQFLLIDRLRSDRLRKQRLIQYGSDPMFWTKQPGFLDREEFEPGLHPAGSGPKLPPYSVIVDETGFLNSNRGVYAKGGEIEMFIAGSSLIQGEGMPSAIEYLKEYDHAPIWILALASYSPRQKVEALFEFALPKRAKVVLMDFTPGDPSLAVADRVCEMHQAGYSPLFDLRELKRLLRSTDPYAAMLLAPREGVGEWLSEHSISFNLAKGVFDRRSFTARVNEVAAAGFPAMVPPGQTHFPLKENARLAWAKAGVALSVTQYDRLMAQVDRSSTRIVMIYNPTSYEVYRKVIPHSMVDGVADEISAYDHLAIERYCRENGLTYWDLTEPFREVASSDRDLYGRLDGAHWTPTGTKAAYSILHRFFVDAGLLPKPAAAQGLAR